MVLDILRNHLELDIKEALFLELDHCSMFQELTKTCTKHQTHMEDTFLAN